MVSDYDDTRQGRVPRRRQGIERAARRRRGSRAPAACRSARTVLLRRARGDRHRLRPGAARRSRAWPSSTASGPTARSPALTEVPRRLLVLGGGPGGRGDGSGRVAPGRVGRARGGGGPRAAAGARSRWGRPSAGPFAADGVELLRPARVGRPPGRRGVRARVPERDELRGDRLLVAAGRRPRTEGLGVETGAGSPTWQGGLGGRAG